MPLSIPGALVTSLPATWPPVYYQVAGYDGRIGRHVGVVGLDAAVTGCGYAAVLQFNDGMYAAFHPYNLFPVLDGRPPTGSQPWMADDALGVAFVVAERLL
ncbi:MAG: hypothetical protein KKB13_18860 [Chloroflexi bacterium]|nr:hypothetical protein [Chloroflexota bacterium]